MHQYPFQHFVKYFLTLIYSLNNSLCTTLCIIEINPSSIWFFLMEKNGLMGQAIFKKRPNYSQMIWKPSISCFMINYKTNVPSSMCRAHSHLRSVCFIFQNHENRIRVFGIIFMDNFFYKLHHHIRYNFVFTYKLLV